MLNLRKLHTSLTKHGAHKIALLLQKYGKGEALDHLKGSEPGINIDAVQARKNLSVGADGSVPELWNDVRALGPAAIGALTLIAIIFSHRDLISAMKHGRKAQFKGLIRRGAQLGGKAFTNFAHTLEELGFSTSHTQNSVAYDLSRLFEIEGLHGLTARLLTLKLRSAGWDGSGNLTDRLISNNLHNVLAISEVQLRNWLRHGSLLNEGLLLEDSRFFSGEDETALGGPFVFRPGHTPKKTGTVGVSMPQQEVTASLRHNEIQSALYEELAKQYGAHCVGTEIKTGQGTTINLVVKTASFCRFYEIKIANSVRACIRQAVPQLLEYAYWGGDTRAAKKLIIVGEFPLTTAGRRYLAFLRRRFGLPIHYQQFSSRTN